MFATKNADGAAAKCLQPEVELLLAAAEALNHYLGGVGELTPELHAQQQRVLTLIHKECEAVIEK